MRLHIANQFLVYKSELSVEECIQQIINSPWEYKGEYSILLWYECKRLSQNQLNIIFKGGQQRRTVRTQYLVEVDEDRDNGITLINMKFVEDLFGVSVPMTYMEDIDRFMKQKVKAVRCECENIEEKTKRLYSHSNLFEDIGKYIKEKLKLVL